ncbi:MAG: glycine--tRNA ligase subunit beta [Bacteroidota bacterium]
MPDLLIEIGVEEIPAPVVLPALDQMRQALDEGLTALRLTHGAVEIYGTPRRLAAIIRDVADRQPDETREVKGPPASAAFDGEGNPTKAAAGFAAKQGVEVTDLRLVEEDKGSFVYATVQEVGKPASDVIPGLLDSLMTGFTFPKTLKWGDLEDRFARPVRWLVALLGEQLLDWEFAGVKAGKTTRGHRFLGQCEVEVASPGTYLETLRAQSVIADVAERRQMIADKAAEVSAQVGGQPRLDPDLLDENNFLVEFPSCILGSYSEHYLSLPEAVPVTVMQKHQRYFPVEDASGKLMPYFIIIRNGDGRGADTIRKGNEKVIVPRLDDAEFYMSEDLKTPLAERIEALKRVTYMESLGTLYDKTKRIEAWVEWLCERLPIGAEDVDIARRAAHLSKCDQVTLMVGDGKLAALQGIIGGHYARLGGEPEGVCVALAQEYLPVRADDPPPSTAAGKLVALADKFDNMCAAFLLGMIPRGTRDPQGLRRQAQAILSVLISANWRFDLEAGLKFGLGLLPSPEPRPKGALTVEEATVAMQEFFNGRIETLLQDEGVSYDVVRAVLAAKWDNAVEIIERARALAEVRKLACDFEAQVDTATRPANIWRTADLASEAQVEASLFADPSEQALWSVYEQSRCEVTTLKSAEIVDYPAIWTSLSTLREPIEKLFDTVMINAEDAALRTNRLAMMRDLDGLYRELADFTQIVQ